MAKGIQMFKSSQFKWTKNYDKFTGTARKSDILKKGQQLRNKMIIKSTKTGVEKCFTSYSNIYEGGKLVSIVYLPEPTVKEGSTNEVILSIFKQNIEIEIKI